MAVIPSGNKTITLSTASVTPQHCLYVIIARISSTQKNFCSALAALISAPVCRSDIGIPPPATVFLLAKLFDTLHPWRYNTANGFNSFK